jgi:hypothetical protein
MESSSKSMRDLAGRLLTAEAADVPASEPYIHEAVRVCGKLQISLVRFAGPDGFHSLMRRALALARRDFPAVSNITVNTDGSLVGLEKLSSEPQNSGNLSVERDVQSEAAIAIIAHLLGLLSTFVGESITLSLVRDAWPVASSDESL